MIWRRRVEELIWKQDGNLVLLYVEFCLMVAMETVVVAKGYVRRMNGSGR